MTDSVVAAIGADDFARRFSLRAKNLMWFLGAGASASAGVPTAWDMVWEFKQQLFISQRRVKLETVADLSNPAVRERLQAHVDGSDTLPASGSPDEYAALFEAVYAAEADRRAYVDAKMAGAKPSYGHFVLATLMSAQLTRVVWTTNFDPLVADACAKVFGTTGQLTTVDLGAPDLASQCISEGRWPVEVKLHGDFRSRRLKNTDDELRSQNMQLRRALVGACSSFGLVVVGYSGRDDSVMDALDDAVGVPGAFPAGLFWLHRGNGLPLPRVGALLARAAEAGIEAGLVPIENFDEIARDVMRLLPEVDTESLDGFGAARRRWTPAPRPAGQRGWPVIRLNALPVSEAPTVCRRVACKIGGYKEVREAVARANVELLVARTRPGVLAFGADADVRRAFDQHGVTEFDLHTIESRRLRYDSAERGLLRAALTRAITRERGMDLFRHRSTDLLAPTDPQDGRWEPLRRLVGPLSGVAGGDPVLKWREGVGTRLDWADDRLWLLIEPRVVFDGVTTENRAAATEFARERTVKRYNRQLNDLVAAWATLLAGTGEQLRALNIRDGVDAVFRLDATTGFSRRVRP